MPARNVTLFLTIANTQSNSRRILSQ